MFIEKKLFLSNNRFVQFINKYLLTFWKNVEDIFDIFSKREFIKFSKVENLAILKSNVLFFE